MRLADLALTLKRTLFSGVWSLEDAATALAFLCRALEVGVARGALGLKTLDCRFVRAVRAAPRIAPALALLAVVVLGAKGAFWKQLVGGDLRREWDSLYWSTEDGKGQQECGKV